MAEIIRSLQSSIVQACPAGAPSSSIAAAATTKALQSSATLNPSLLHSQQKEAQQGLRSAVQPSGSSTNGAQDRKGGDSLTIFTTRLNTTVVLLAHIRIITITVNTILCEVDTMECRFDQTVMYHLDTKTLALSMVWVLKNVIQTALILPQIVEILLQHE
jgi:hypothetical protein